jgi:hypothetical protein
MSRKPQNRKQTPIKKVRIPEVSGEIMRIACQKSNVRTGFILSPDHVYLQEVEIK